MRTRDDWQTDSKLVPLMMLIFYLTVMYKVLYLILSYVEPYLTNPFWNTQTTAVLYLTMLTILNIALYFLYTRKPAWAMKWKINSMAWPWEENPEAWKKLLRRSTKVYVGFSRLPSVIGCIKLKID